MAKRLSTEEQFGLLGRLTPSLLSASERELVLAALGDSSNIVIARAAEVIADSGSSSFAPALIAAFDRLLPKGAAADKNCLAKEAIVRALDAIDNYLPEPYLHGVTHVQMEPVFLKTVVDTAAILRGRCAAALTRMRYHDTPFVLVQLLADPELPARKAAINALAYLGTESSELLLRLKALTGDADAALSGHCFGKLLEISLENSLPFVAGFLSAANREIAEQAAIALGDSSDPRAFAHLRDCWEANTDFTFRRTLVFAIALIRDVTAFDFLLEVVREEGRSSALHAVEALAIYRHDEKRRGRLAQVVKARGDEKLTACFNEHCPG